MKTLKIIINRLFKQLVSLELMLNYHLGALLFGSAAEVEFEDLPLPSETKERSPQTKPTQIENHKAKKKQTQLRLFFSRALKRFLLRLVESIESMVLSNRIKNTSLEGNRYLH